MGAPRLDRLIGRSGLAELLSAAVALEPGLSIRVVDAGGRELGRAGTRGPVDDRRVPGVPPSTRQLAVAGMAVGSVAVVGLDSGRTATIADVLARAIELAATEGLGRRAVTAAAVDDLRELALLSRLAETLGSAIDPAAIAGCVLATISRPLGAALGMVLGPDDATVLAADGRPAEIEALRADANAVVGGLRAEDPAIGSCAAIASPASGRFGSILAAFLRTARGHHGTIVLGRATDGEPFTAGDRQLLASVASQSALAIERAALLAQTVERRALDEELAIGRRIQLSLMPRRFPTFAGWEIASAYEPAREVGGDFYDVFRLRDRGGCVGLVVADVTGKGIPAAILMADSRGLIHAAADNSEDPATTLERVNRILVEERASGLFVTVAHAILDPASGRLTLARAGHDPVHILRADGRLEILDPPGRLIGMVADLGLQAIERILEPGDAFVAHTDGVTEARDASGAFFGEERYRALLVSLAGATAAGIVDAVTADVSAFRGRAESSDDLTLLVVRRGPAER